MKLKSINIFKISDDGKRIYGLDILRALAILFVVIGHGGHYLPKPLNIISGYLTFDGVSFFFVLSGFLIGGILIKLLENNKPTIRSLFNFWIRRWLRTLPNYYLILLSLFVFLPLVFYGTMSNPFRHIKYLFFLQNLNSPQPHFFDESWSLCVEEWFYIIVPIVIFFLVGLIQMTVKKAVLLVAVSLIVISMLFRYFKYATLPIHCYGDWDLNIRRQVFTRLDSNMFGMVGAFMSYYYNSSWKKYKQHFFVVGVVLLVALRFFDFFDNFGIYTCVFSFSLLSLGVLFLLPQLSEYKKGSGFVFRVTTFISIISYSMYLLNLSIFGEFGVLLLQQFPLTGITYMFVQYLWYWFFIITGSAVLYKFFEKPMMELREKFK
jgi:peptidoglycan/LPS O-acetylase OafA/YrhL